MADQLSYKFVKYNRFNDWIITPCIDDLAEKGIRFNQAYCSSPLCIPSRQSFYTGRNTRHHGCICDYKVLEKKTMFHYLREFGINSYAVGKCDFRFDHDQYHGLTERPGFDIGAQDTVWGSNNYSSFIGNTVTTINRERDEQCDLISLTSLRTLQKPENMVLLTSYLKPHDSWDNGLWWDAPKSFWELYNNAPVQNQSLKGYAANISLLDHHIGWLLREADEQGLLDNTLVIFASDHGELAGAHGRWGKQTMEEEAIRVPLIVWHKGIKPKACNHVVGLIDIFPTIFSYLGIPCPNTDGTNLLDEKIFPDRHVFIEVFWGKYIDGKFCTFDHKPLPCYQAINNVKRCIRLGCWKYVDNGFEKNLFMVSPNNIHDVTERFPRKTLFFKEMMEKEYPLINLFRNQANKRTFDENKI